ncbi:oligosaccharide flippase family protein [Vibrio alginolyticus]|uniref:lipopolysaccharide biosynthesis protein n=2 Tax=Vibrionaceae TaxID=641 RepID=UPI00148D6B0D|nr:MULTISPECIES: oligosaccharide flippase family protein [Vibrio]NOI43115.1 oligosaccharide flippase family protein [Vibrio alginolyticus]HBC3489958.1 oligosaccharide flippase family protein [Vibrio alginolyticus]
MSELMELKKVIKFALGPIAGALLGLVSLPIITWFFNQEDVGRISMLQITVSLTTLVFCLGLDQSYVREYHDENNKARLFKIVWLPTSLFLLVAATLTIIFTDTKLSILLFELDSISLTLLTILLIVTSLSARFFSLILRMEERGLAYSLSQVLPKIMVLVVLGLYIILDIRKSFDHLLYAYVIAGVGGGVVLAWTVRNTIKKAIDEVFDSTKFKEMLSFGLPLVLGAFAYWGLTAADKLMLRALSTYKELGLYSVAISFASAATILQSVFSTVWAPTVYKWASNNENIDKVHEVTSYITLAVGVLFSLAGACSWLVTFLLPEEYISVQWVLIVCMGAPLLYTLSETTAVGIGITRRSSFSMLASIIAFLTNIIGNYLLVPQLGAKGAGISTCIAFFVLFVLRTEFSSRLWIPIKRLKLYTVTFLLVVGAISSALYGENFPLYIPTLWLTFLVFLLITYKVNFRKLLLFVKNRKI